MLRPKLTGKIFSILSFPYLAARVSAQCQPDDCSDSLFPCTLPEAVAEAITFCATLGDRYIYASSPPARAILACGGNDTTRYASACSCRPTCVSSMSVHATTGIVRATLWTNTPLLASTARTSDPGGLAVPIASSFFSIATLNVNCDSSPWSQITADQSSDAVEAAQASSNTLPFSTGADIGKLPITIPSTLVGTTPTQLSSSQATGPLPSSLRDIALPLTTCSEVLYPNTSSWSTCTSHQLNATVTSGIGTTLSTYTSSSTDTQPDESLVAGSSDTLRLTSISTLTFDSSPMATASITETGPACKLGSSNVGIADGDFEDGLSPWDFDVRDARISEYGIVTGGADGSCHSFMVQLLRAGANTEDPGFTLISPLYDVTRGSRYILSFWVKFSVKNTARIGLRVEMEGKEVIAAIAWQQGADWTKVQSTFIPSQNWVELKLDFDLDGSSSNIFYIDEIQLNLAPPSTTARAGPPVTAPPRIATSSVFTLSMLQSTPSSF